MGLISEHPLLGLCAESAQIILHKHQANVVGALPSRMKKVKLVPPQFENWSHLQEYKEKVALSNYLLGLQPCHHLYPGITQL